MTAFVGRREFITLVGGAAVRGRLRRGRSRRCRWSGFSVLDRQSRPPSSWKHFAKV